MKDEQRQFLSLLPDPPARIIAVQAAWILNCQEHDIPQLVSARLLKPLGNPPVNGVKYFATSQVLELSKDVAWLAKATNVIHQFWRTKNARKKNAGGHRDSGPASLTNGAALA